MEIQSVAAWKKNRAGWGMWELQTNSYEKDERQDRRPAAEMEEQSKYGKVRIRQDKVDERTSMIQQWVEGAEEGRSHIMKVIMETRMRSVMNYVVFVEGGVFDFLLMYLYIRVLLF